MLKIKSLPNLISESKIVRTLVKKYLKSYQVKNLLKISGGTLQTLRANGTLKFTRIGHIIYYNYEDIMQLLEVSPKKSKRQ